MKKLTLALLFIFALVLGSQIFQPSEKDLYRKTLNEHPYSTRPHLAPEDIKKMPKQDRPDLAWEQDFLETMDPALGRPPTERLIAVYNQVAQSQAQLLGGPGAVSTPWVERGPNNVGGRTRALMFDPNDLTKKKVWAGGVTGGLWYNNDITSSSSQWTAVNDFWDNIAISCIAFDPNNTNTFYVGTGEGWGAGASRGAGIWKTTNGGTTWTQLASTTGFYYVNDIVVRNESGTSVLYAAVAGGYYSGQWHGSANAGLQRSTNGGTSFTQVLPNVPSTSNNYVAADIELGSNGKIWVGTTNFSYGGTDRGGGRVLTSTNGTTWTTAYTSSGGERVEVACAPSDANYAYALIESGNALDAVVKTTNGGTTWTSVSEPNDADNGIPSTDFTRGQAWYDLILAVDPNNRNTIIAGGIDLFRSTNAGSTWTQISKWSNNNNLAALNCSYVHADQHAIVFAPGSSSKVIFGNDGGVFYSSNISSAGTSNVIFARNNGYNVTQFYAGAIHPTAGNNYMLAGAQDNGTQKLNGVGISAATQATGGDGAYCFIDQTNANYQITSYVYNSYWRSTNGGNSWGSRFQSDQSTGKFINPTDYDDNLNILYSTRTNTTINRVTGITGTPSIGNFTVTGMNSKASHLRVSPYTTTSTTLFVGTEAGDLYKITNANSSPSTTSIGGSLPSGTISCVEIGASENELLVTLKNYGVTSVWYTSNGGTTWQNKEGNLPDMPVRWALFNPNDRTEVILATEVGVWATSNILASSPSWTPSNSGLANVRVDMLQIRDSDSEVMAATFGRGVFTSNGFVASQPPLADFSVSKKYPCISETVTLNDSSSGNPTSWKWTISPNTFSYVSSSSTSQNPEVSFTAAGWYSVKLVISNANGSDSTTISQAIKVGGHDLPFTEDFETSSVTEWSVDNPDASNTWALGTVAGNSPGTQAAVVDNFNYNGAGQKDGLISPAIDLTGYTQATLSFEYAYRRYSSSYTDSLAVYISTNCGTSWTRIALYGENGTGNFATGSDYTSSFVPATSADWCGGTGSPTCSSININAYAGSPGVLLKFENINGYGNNMYVDNINVTGLVSVAPVADFSASSTTVCQGASSTFTDLSTNTPTSWAWTFSPNTVTYIGGTSASSQNPQVQFNGAGTYQVSLSSTNAIGTDAEVKAGFITVTNALTPTVSASTTTTSICAGSTVNFTSSNSNGGTNPSYQWKVNGTNVGSNLPTYSSSTLSNNDIVTLEMTSSESCVTSSTVQSAAITMTVVPLPSITINTGTGTMVCVGDVLPLQATVNNQGFAGQGVWSGTGVVGTDFVATAANAGWHTLTYTYTTNQSSCTSSSTLSVMVLVIPKPTITQSGTLLTCTQSGYTYQWIKDGVAIPGAIAKTHTITGNGTYEVEITKNGCSELSDPTVFNSFGMDDLVSAVDFKLYPNPSTGQSYFEMSNPGVSTINYKLIAFNGQVVQSHQIKVGAMIKEPLDLSTLASGVYTLQIRLGDQEIIKRLTKM